MDRAVVDLWLLSPEKRSPMSANSRCGLGGHGRGAVVLDDVCVAARPVSVLSVLLYTIPQLNRFVADDDDDDVGDDSDDDADDDDDSHNADDDDDDDDPV